MLFAFVLIIFGSCKTKPQPDTTSTPLPNLDTALMTQKWKTVDSLQQKGLIKTALTVVQEIRAQAMQTNASDHLVKAILHEFKFLNQLQEDSGLKSLQQVESEIATYPEPARSVMHSLAADWYLSYMQQNLWQLRNRTEYTGDPGPDFRTWGIRHFVEKIQSHYQKSVEWPGLKTTPVEDYSILLTDAKGTDHLRPTLYDILVNRAIDFFEGTESYLTAPVYQFVLADPAAFGPVRNFVEHDFATEDTLSNTWIALKWYQQLLAFRLNDEVHIDALIDADVKRLRFVYDHIVVDQKDSLYEAALLDITRKYSQNAESSLAQFELATLYAQQASNWVNDKSSPHRFGYVKAMEICRATIAKFPDAYGSQLCRQLMAETESKSLSAVMENVVLPDEELLTQISYRNVDKIHLRLVKLPASPNRWRGDNWNSDEILRRLNQLISIRTWEQALDDGDDYQPHTTEIPVQSLPYGHYTLLISDQGDFESKKSTTGALMFTVSELGYWHLDDRDDESKAAVVSRRSGMPLANVKAEFFTKQYVSGKQRAEETKIGEETTDANGWMNVPRLENKSVMIRLTKGLDELYPEESYHRYRYGRAYDANPTTLFFSDRAIYRPGQKIYFKGYALEFDKYQIPRIIAKKNVEVVLYDANGQEQLTKTFVTNEYGTFAGHFEIPQGGLTGQMSISSSHGSSHHYFQVEEYKRPKFEITYDTLQKSVRLNETVTVTGHAMDYAGSPLANAEVKYRVERSIYRPWWYTYYSRYWADNDAKQVLSTGTSRTAADGSFEITFDAKPKPGSNDNLMYRFEVTSFITDITGESHELTKVIVINKQGYDVNIRLDDKVAINELGKVTVIAKNSEGADVAVTGEVTISKLQGPTNHKRNRLWEKPDILTISETEYAARFVNYFIPGKEEMSSWNVLQTSGTSSYNVTGSDSINLSKVITAPGYYKLSWKWKDEEGKELPIEQFVMVYDKSKLLPGPEAMQVDVEDIDYAPGTTAQINLLTGLNFPLKAIRIVERRKTDETTTWQPIPQYNDKSINITEDDRGGIYVHHLTAFNNRFYQNTNLLRVPWTNKDLQVHLKTWRDKMEPGDEENWTITVKGSKQEAVTAEMLLSMYDASLDAFVPHEWSMRLYPSAMSKMLIRSSATSTIHYWGLTHHWSDGYLDVPIRQYRDINLYGYFPQGAYYYGEVVRGSRAGNRSYAIDGVAVMEAPAAPEMSKEASLQDSDNAEEVQNTSEPFAQVPPTAPPLRSALDETVFFYPQLKTDEQGNLTFNFKMKEGLTRWKFQALGHTKDLAFGLTQAEAVTQKELMVFPNPPRFFREGDTIAFQIKASNLTDQALKGTAHLKILNAITNEDVSAQWNLKSTQSPFELTSKGSAPVTWMLTVPKKWVVPVKYQVSASAGNLTDGEESMLPVVTNRILITETLPLPVKAKETKTFVFKSMMENKSATSEAHRYTVEMTTTPAWYAVQALPYLMEYPYECAEQIFSRLYANTLATHIANKLPAIKNTYEIWRQTNSDALVSNLEKNEELKSAMLEETPWVRDAMGETAQKKDIGLLFESNKMRGEIQEALTKLRQMQLANGAFSWFPEGRANWYITQYIVEGFGHLKKMGITMQGNDGYDIVQRAIPYIDASMIEWYDDLKRAAEKGRIKMEDQNTGALQIHYLYARSFFPEIRHNAKMDEVITYVKSQCEKYWLQNRLYEQGLIALAFYRMTPDNELSSQILASLREKTIVHEELGRYWKMMPGFYWYEAPVEFQSLMVELYQDMKVPQAEVDELRVWLLKQKQTTRWKSTKATAAAIYALLIHPDTWLSSEGIVEVKIGNESVIDQSSATEPGSGYVKKSWDGGDVKDNWSNVTVKNPNNHIAWGAAYYQYWEDIDKVKSDVSDNPLKVSRELLIVKQSDRGENTNIAPAHDLKVGDKLMVRLIIESDRAMEFVHLKDVRASGFEPMDVISGYKWNQGIGYYQSTKDLATHFFIDYLPRGKYVIEYPVTVAQAGAYSEGLASLQCMYAPEFADHSAGQRVKAH